MLKQMLSQESKVFEEGLNQLSDLMDQVDQLYSGVSTSGSVLLHELAAADNPLEALYDSTQTPIVHAMSSVHAYINVFVHLSRGAQVKYSLLWIMLPLEYECYTIFIILFYKMDK